MYVKPALLVGGVVRCGGNNTCIQRALWSGISCEGGNGSKPAGGVYYAPYIPPNTRCMSWLAGQVTYHAFRMVTICQPAT